MIKFNEGDIVVCYFEDKSYLDFIQKAFVNVLVSGIKVQLEPRIGKPFEFYHIIFATVAAPGIDRIRGMIHQCNGKMLLPAE